MNELMKKVLEIFKSKKIELSAEEAEALLTASRLAPSAPDATAKTADSAPAANGAQESKEEAKTAASGVDTPNIKHNAGTVQEVEKFYKDELAKKDAVIQTMGADIAQIKKLLGDQQSATEKANALIEENRKKEHADKVSKKLDEAIKAGKIPKLNTDLQAKYKAALETDYDNAAVIIDNLPGQPTTDAQTVQGGESSPSAKTGLGTIVPDHIMARLEKN